MGRISLGVGVLSILAGAQALAADMPARLPTKAPAAVVSTWSGFYGGANAGWGWTEADATATATGTNGANLGPIPPFSAKANGGLLGLQLGYNWQTGPWVFGFEADWDAASIFGSQQLVFIDAGGFDAAFQFQARVNWLATLRGRIGYSTGPGLLYVTGGAAWENATVRMMGCETTAGPCAASDYNFTKSGWVVGGGYEWMFARHWSVRPEYLYYAFNAGRADTAPFVGLNAAGSLTTNPARHDVHVARLALNYHFGDFAAVGALAAAKPAATNPSAALDFNWSGFYGGVNAGWGWTEADATAAASGAVVTSGRLGTFLPAISFKADGGLLGLQLGYNRQTGSWIFGIEGDWDAASITGSQQSFFADGHGAGAGLNSEDRVNWLATLRGRIGYSMGPGLIYVTGGAAWQDRRIKTMVASASIGESAFVDYTFTKSGWVAGVGYEWMFARRWSARGEYLHYGFAAGPAGGAAFSTTFGVPGTLMVAPARQDIDVVRLGLNYHLPQ